MCMDELLMATEQPTRVYSAPGVTVEWYKDRCVKCHACVEGLPAVFNADARPWININAAPAEDIIRQVKECPANAISIPE